VIGAIRKKKLTRRKRTTRTTQTEETRTFAEIGIQCDLLCATSSPEDGLHDTDDTEEVDDQVADPDYVPEMDDESGDSDCEEDSISSRGELLNASVPPKDEKQFLVSETALHTLLNKCRLCDNTSNVVLTHQLGTMCTFLATCTSNSKHTFQWQSQSLLSGMPTGNLRCASMILFAGASPSKTLTMFKHMNMPMFSSRTYFQIQSCYLVPATMSVWKTQQDIELAAVRGIDLVLGGDARCDSPGHSAKYGTYTLMDIKNTKVLECQLVQVSTIK
jgi:hypothetical protein